MSNKFAGFRAVSVAVVAGGLLAAVSPTSQAGPFPANVELSNLNVHKGLLVKNGATGHLGVSVSGAGDVNGDGVDDFIVGSRSSNPSTSSSSERGFSYVVFGNAGGLGETLDLSLLDGSNGFQLTGVPGDHAHGQVSKAGDVNGDGIDDLIIGADTSGAIEFTGKCYVVFGHTGSFSAEFDLSTLSGVNGFVLNARTDSGPESIRVANAGDINGDGISDVVVGLRHGSSATGSGAAYVVFGKSTGFASAIDLSSLNGGNGFVMYSTLVADGIGSAVSGVGDVNADGVDDLILGASAIDSRIDVGAAAYVVFGKTTPFASTLELSTLNGANGFSLNSGGVGPITGHSVSGVGDINNDGSADVVVSSRNGSYVVFGKSGGFAPALDLSALNGVNGFVVVGSSTSVSGGGDINGDGVDDLLIGDYRKGPAGQYFGGAYVVYGNSSGFGAQLDAATLDGSNGFAVNGVARDDYTGWSVSVAGDVNNDGVSDFVLGAPGISSSFVDGVTYLVFGRVDLDGDGMLDPWESANGLNPAIDDATGDADLDGLSNIDEYNAGSDPQNPDTDGDGILDGADPIPLVARVRLDFDGNGMSDFPLYYSLAGRFSPAFVDSFSPIPGISAVQIRYSHPTIDSGFFGENLPDPWKVAAIEDFDGDHQADVLWRNTSTGETRIWFCNDRIVREKRVLAFVPTNFEIAGSGDFNGDQRADILWRNAGNGVMAIWFMNGTAVSSAEIVGVVPSPWTVAAVDDFDGDFRADILWRHPTFGITNIWLLDGATVKAHGLVGVIPAIFDVAATGDFDGDNRADIFWRNTATGGVSRWLLDGLSIIDVSTFGVVPLTYEVKAAGDYNGDRSADILWARDGALSIWFMNAGTVSGTAVGGGPFNSTIVP